MAWRLRLPSTFALHSSTLVTVSDYEVLYCFQQGRARIMSDLRETAGGIHISVHSELRIMAIYQIFLSSKSMQSFESSYGRV
jgi:hypothetical protein